MVKLLTSEEEQIIRVVSCICSGCSIIAILGLNVVYIAFSRIRRYSSNLIMITSVAIVVKHSSMFLLPDRADSWRCLLQAGMLIYGEVAVYIFSLFIGLYCFLYITNNNSFTSNKKAYLICFTLAGTIVPAIVTAIPFFRNTVGKSGPWCFLDLEGSLDLKKNNFKDAVFVYITCLSFLILNMYLLTKIFIIKTKISKIRAEHQLQIVCEKKVVNVIIKYSLAVLICFIPSCVNRTYTLVTQTEHFGLYLFHCICQNILGVLFLTIFLLNLSKDDLKTITPGFLRSESELTVTLKEPKHPRILTDSEPEMVF